MEANECDVNRVNTEALLPPRKRLLAGFKRQISDIEGSSSSPPPPVVIAPSSSTFTHSSPPPYPTLTSSDFNHPLNLFLSSNHDKYQNMSPYEIMEASKSAAYAAMKAAEVARAAAREKSTIAAKAVSAAKAALALVASYPEEDLTSGRERQPKKNKLKKQVQVQVLYKKHKLVGNSVKKHINDGNPFPDTSDEAVVADIESDHSVHLASARTKEKVNGSPMKKRGRLKLKKLPLSVCNFRDQRINNEETVQRAITVQPLFPVEPLAGNGQTPSVWKCEELKGHNVKQTKVLQF